MKIKRFILVTAAVVHCLGAQAKHVSISKAAAIAAKHMTEVCNMSKKVLPVENSSMLKAQAAGAYTSRRTKQDAYYVFNAEDGNGFVIVSGDDLLPQIVGYSTTGSITYNDGIVNENLEFFLDCYSKYVNNVREGKVKPYKTLSNNITEVVSPLLKTEWSQTYPYNMYAPEYDIKYSSYRNHSPVGCVAVAIAQVMNYWKWPDCIDTKGDILKAFYYPYIDSVGTISNECQPIYLDLTTQDPKPYEWDLITDNYLSYNNAEGVNDYEAKAEATGRLLRDVAYAFNMRWNDGGGSATDLPAPLIKYFGYSKDCQNLLRYSYEGSNAAQVWLDIIKENFLNGQPIVYGAYNLNCTGGHCFVLDGFDSADRVHVNWGWGPQYNGWFDITCLNSEMNNPDDDGTYNFSFGCSFLHNLHPNYDATQEISTALITDAFVEDLYAHVGENKNTYFNLLNSGSVFLNSARNNKLVISTDYGNWLFGCDFDGRFVITGQNNDTVLLERKNVMQSENKSAPDWNYLYHLHEFSVEESIYSLKNGTYTVQLQFNVKNEAGDSTGYHDAYTEFGRLNKFYIIKENDQCLVTSDLSVYNPIFHELRTDSNYTNWINIYSTSNIDSLQENDKLTVFTLFDFPYKSLEQFNLDAGMNGYIDVINIETGQTERIIKDDLTKWLTNAQNLAADDNVKEGLLYSRKSSSISLPAGNYMLNVNYPLFKLQFKRSFSVRGNTPGDDTGTDPVNGNDGNAEHTDNNMYNLLGIPVDNNYHGIVINNGRPQIQ